LEQVYESPKDFYLQKRRKSLALITEKDQPIVISQDVNDTRSLSGSISSIQSFQSIESVLSRKESKESLNVPNLEQSVGYALSDGALNPILAALGFLNPENSFFDLIHAHGHRKVIYTPFEIYKYRTINDIGTPHDAYTEMPIEDEDILEFEKNPGKDLERLNFLIKSSPAPVPSNFRRRGYVHLRCGKYEEAISDLIKSLTYGNSEF